MKGNLHDMAVADLIQHVCRDRKTAKVSIRISGRQAVLFFEDGNIVHASLDDMAGEEVIYEILRWEEGSFEMEIGVKPPAKTIEKSWSSLLLEGARRLDETGAGDAIFPADIDSNKEATEMASNYEQILKEMSNEITGYIASALVGMDGINLASNAKAKVDADAISGQMTVLLKLIDVSVEKLGAGEVEDNLTTTEAAYLLMRPLPGKQYYLGMVADRKTGNLGNMRLISKTYAERVSKAMPR
jgi:predicted regulator of Ras-like GTPase activity (Roadblock/LC7/MglB family)